MNQNTHYDICILGSANSDLFLKVKDFPKQGETINALDSFIKNGGKGANQGVASARLGSKSVFAGQMGKDGLANLLIQEMKESGLDLSGLNQIDSAQTGQAIILLDEKGQNSIIIIGGANMTYSTLETLPIEYQNAIGTLQYNSLAVQLQMEVPQAINILAATRAYDQGKIVMLDCGGRAEKFQKELLEHLHFISPNETELERIVHQEIDENTPEEQLIKIVQEKALTHHQSLIVLLKLGSNGSLLISKDHIVRVLSATHYNKQILDDYKIIDSVGAGDCFTSAFCTQFLREIQKKNLSSMEGFENNQILLSLEFYSLEKEVQKNLLQQSMLFASSAAFLCITKHGAMPSLPKRQEVEEFMAKYNLNI